MNLYSTEEFNESVEICKKLIEEVFKQLQFHKGILQYLSIVDIKPVNDPNTTMRICTSDDESYLTLKYNPIWMKSLKDIHSSLLTSLFYAEGLRIALHHCTTRRLQPLNICYQASNIICFDNIPTLYFWEKSIEKLTKYIPNYKSVANLIEPIGFNKETMFSLETLHEYLCKVLNTSQKSNQNNKESNNNDSEQKSNQNNNDSEQKSNQNFNETNNSNSGKYTNAKEAIKNHFENINNSMEWGENDLIENKIDNISNQIMRENEDSVWGSLPGNIKELIKKIVIKKIKPEVILKHFKQSIISEELYDTRLKINRRHGDILPGWRHKIRNSLLWAIDVSGSMSDKNIAIGLNFVNQFIKHADTYFSYWDTTCSDIVKEHKPITNETRKIVGGGGTIPECIIDKLNNTKRLKINGIIVFTDNYFQWCEPPKKYKNKILIISTSDAPFPSWCKHKIYLSDIFKKQKLNMKNYEY